MIGRIFPVVREWDKKLEGNPDHVLTVILIVTAFILIAIALSHNTTVKAFIAAWVILP